FLKGVYIEPFLRCARTGVWVANQARTVRGKSGDLRRLPLQRNVVRVEYRERPATHDGHNSVQLPIAENVPVPTAGVLEERQRPLITQHETIVGIEHRPAALGREIEWILRQIVFSGDRLRSRAGNVEGRNVIDGVRPRVGRKEGQAVAEALAQTGFQSVVAGVRDAGDFTDRTISAITVRIRQRTSRIETTVVHIVFGGNRARGRRRTTSARVIGDRAGDKDWRIALNESRQPHAGGTNVPDLEEQV